MKMDRVRLLRAKLAASGVCKQSATICTNSSGKAMRPTWKASVWFVEDIIAVATMCGKLSLATW